MSIIMYDVNFYLATELLSVKVHLIAEARSTCKFAEFWSAHVFNIPVTYFVVLQVCVFFVFCVWCATFRTSHRMFEAKCCFSYS